MAFIIEARIRKSLKDKSIEKGYLEYTGFYNNLEAINRKFE